MTDADELTRMLHAVDARDTVLGGKITQLTLQLFHLEGNLDVPAVAAGRTPVGTPATRSG